ncbi:MAG: ArnT family glycosyltransferase [Weeksellaceae bacterium]
MISPKSIRVVSLIIISIVGWLVVFYQFPLIPQHLNIDEVEFAQLALSLDGKAYAPYSPLATGHTTLYYYVILLCFKLFGITAFGLRLPAALSGVINGILIYMIMYFLFVKKEDKKPSMFSLFLPLATALTFVTMRWQFQFARFSFEVTFLMMFELLSLLFIILHQRTKSWKWLLAAGIAAGLAFNSYLPGRVFVAIPGLYVLWYIWSQQKHWKERFQTILSFFIPFLIVITPLLMYFMQARDVRVYQLSYVNNEMLSLNEKISFFTENVRKTAGIFHIQGDLNGKQNYPGKPALNPIMGILFVIGMLYSIRKIKVFPHFIFLAYFVLSLIPTILTYPWENPHMLRTYTSIPAIVFWIGTAFWLIYNKFKRQYLIMAFITALLIISVVYDLRTYFIYQVPIFDAAFEMRGPLHELVVKIKLKH